jgi:membrane protein involved in colicin uptake
MLSRFSLRAFQCLALFALLFVAVSDVQAQFGKLTKKLPGMGGSSEVDTILSQMDSARVKSAYARVTLSLADDVIRRQALRNSTKKSAEGQIEKDKKEIEALDRSIAEKRKLLAELGKQTNSGKYDEKTAQQVETQTKAEEQQRSDKRAMVDQEIADKEKNEKDLSKQDRENYGKLARLLYGAAKQEREALETAQDVKPRAESAAKNTSKNPLNMASTQPKKLNDGMKGLNEILAEGPQHVSTLASVANHLAKIGGVDLTDPKFQPKVATDEDEIPTDW